MKNIRIEEVGDIHSHYRYMEVFFTGGHIPFLDISITEERELSFKIYASKSDIILTIEEWEHIFKTAKEFLPTALRDEDENSSNYYPD